MADKRISQLIERVDIANNDVLPIVANGATTTNKVTISTIQEWMQDNLDVGVTSVGITIGSTGTDINVTGSPVTSSGNITINIPTASATNRGLLSSANWTTFNNKLSSVGLTMPSAFTVSNSPLTANGTIAVTGAGTVAQYIRGDGSLADFPEGGGGGSAVNYYLNGSVSQGTIGGIGYYEMNKVPVLGTGTDFVAIADGYLASFITDAGDPGLLEIPAGNWNFETYFSASSGGGSPSFYIELYKVNSGGTATLIASNSATPELIAFGTVINPYFSTLAVPTTVLTITDRLALRYYVARSGRTITLHTENSHLCQIITTFTTGLTALNGLTAQVQNFATGTSGTDFNISSSSATHTFNLPDASASARGVVTTGTQTFAGIKTFNSTITAGAEVQLVQAGTALPTFIKNISGSGLTSSGSNGIGFNNSNNLYISGSDKGGAVFSINNTGVRTYTFQDNNGTLAFTSDLGGYLPLTGGTLTGAIVGTTSTFTNSGAGIGLGVTNSGSGDGVKITHSAGRAFNIQSSGAGFGLIINNETASTSAPFTIQKQGTNKVAFTDAGAADFSSSVTASSFVKSSGTSAQFLKADGSVDSSTYLTTGTAASTYLPLAGGTLTGALNGTSASFSASSAAVSISNASDLWYNVTRGASITNIGIDATGTFYNTNTSHRFLTNSGTINALTLASTGAATFSSSVTAGAGTSSGYAVLGLIDSGTGSARYGSIRKNYDSPFDLRIRASNSESEAPIVFDLSNDTEAMRITSTGNVGIGTASPNRQLTLSSSQAVMSFNATSYRNTTIGSDATGSFIVYDDTAAAYRMVINSSGNVGIGTASPARTLHVLGASGIGTVMKLEGASGTTTYLQLAYNGATNAQSGYIGYDSSSNMTLFTNDTERMRITSGGDMILQGVNSSKIHFYRAYSGDPSNVGMALFNTSGTTVVSLNGNGGGIYTASLGTGIVYSSGGLLTSTNPSDERLKDNIENISWGLDEILKLRPVNYTWKDDPIDQGIQYGFIAQEVQEVMPEAVKEFGEETKYLGLEKEAIYVTLVKAIQEQQEQIKSLTEQVEALKSQING